MIQDRLGGKVIVVAGGGTGIGRGTALQLAREGAAVVIGDLSAERAEAVADTIRAGGGRAEGRAFDMIDEASIAALLDAASAFGGLDGVHVNAADLAAHRFDTDAVAIDLEVSTGSSRSTCAAICSAPAWPSRACWRGAAARSSIPRRRPSTSASPSGWPVR
jgi:NAD(P)-dependent dehydrogenase (short-subunit alcohol dehydrogenase family)